MFDWAISDLHLGHHNIIEYDDRPFNSVEEMNEFLIRVWNNNIQDDDNVLYLGDLTLEPSENSVKYLSQLNGDIYFIRGNHDRIRITDGAKVFDDVTFTMHSKKFHCVHDPSKYDSNIPNEWVIHGHAHTELEDYPFMDTRKQYINLAAPLLSYYPIKWKTLLNYIDQLNGVYRTRADVPET